MHNAYAGSPRRLARKRSRPQWPRFFLLRRNSLLASKRDPWNIPIGDVQRAVVHTPEKKRERKEERERRPKKRASKKRKRPSPVIEFTSRLCGWSITYFDDLLWRLCCRVVFPCYFPIFLAFGMGRPRSYSVSCQSRIDSSYIRRIFRQCVSRKTYNAFLTSDCAHDWEKIDLQPSKSSLWVIYYVLLVYVLYLLHTLPLSRHFHVRARMWKTRHLTQDSYSWDRRWKISYNSIVDK